MAGEGSQRLVGLLGVGAADRQRGALGAFNANWDADWTVQAQVTERGWEAELAIPLKTLRYNPGTDKTWGFNAMRNIRRKNEQVYLAPVPRGYNLTRVSEAAQADRARPAEAPRPEAHSVRRPRYLETTASRSTPVDGSADVGLDFKWGITPSLTADLTVNTDFAQVEADEEQVNLTRFELFFPEKRPFFLENASMFQFGASQQIDLFFSRRIGFEAGTEAPILGGGRVSGKAGAYNVGVLNMQTDRDRRRPHRPALAPPNNFFVSRVQREFGRSNVGAIFVNRQGTGDAAGSRTSTAPTASTRRCRPVQRQAFRVHRRAPTSPEVPVTGRGTAPTSPGGSSTHTTSPAGSTTTSATPASATTSTPRSATSRAPATTSAPYRFFLDWQPKKYPYVRRFSPHIFENWYWGLDGNVQTMRGHYHFLEIQPRSGGRWGARIDREQDRPTAPFVIYSIPTARAWSSRRASTAGTTGRSSTSAIRARAVQLLGGATFGSFYDGDWTQIAVNLEGRVGDRFTASVGYTQADIDLPYGNFVTKLVPTKLSYSFTRWPPSRRWCSTTPRPAP